MTNLDFDLINLIDEDMLDVLTENDFKEIVHQSIDRFNMTTEDMQYFPNHSRLIERDRSNLYANREGIQRAFPNKILATIFDLNLDNFANPNGYLEIVIELTDKHVLCSFPLDGDFRYFSIYSHTITETKWVYNSFFLSYDKKAIPYKTFVRLLLAVSQQESNTLSNRMDESILTKDLTNFDRMEDFIHLEGLYESVDTSLNLFHFNTLPFTHVIKQLNSTQTLYRLKFGSATNPSFKFKYRINDTDGLGYRIKGIYFMDILFNESTVESITCFKYTGTLSLFQNTIHENLLEDVPFFSEYLTSKYQQLSHKDLLNYDIVTDLRENVLNGLNDTDEGRLLYEHLLTNIDFHP